MPASSPRKWAAGRSPGQLKPGAGRSCMSGLGRWRMMDTCHQIPYLVYQWSTISTLPPYPGHSWHWTSNNIYIYTLGYVCHLCTYYSLFQSHIWMVWAGLQFLAPVPVSDRVTGVDDWRAPSSEFRRCSEVVFEQTKTTLDCP